MVPSIIKVRTSSSPRIRCFVTVTLGRGEKCACRCADGRVLGEGGRGHLCGPWPSPVALPCGPSPAAHVLPGLGPGSEVRRRRRRPGDLAGGCAALEGRPSQPHREDRAGPAALHLGVPRTWTCCSASPPCGELCSGDLEVSWGIAGDVLLSPVI